ncbi:hypothetical protein ACFSUJ_28175 [Streptomyces lusitanus]|uniref:Uncharacterized protein n=1 Tax=Streptomyces lusitanus TaxID=68232 RepID=A0ABU3JQM3_9ACTN|nr:hypothetical protein [Streptomyces lusitanus]
MKVNTGFGDHRQADARSGTGAAPGMASFAGFLAKTSTPSLPDSPCRGVPGWSKDM